MTLSVVGDHAFIPGPWHASDGTPPGHTTPTSFYTAVQLHCIAHVIDHPEVRAELPRRRLAHFQPAGDHARGVPGEAPFDRMLPGIRGIRLGATDVRAKFKYGGNRPREMRRRVADRLAGRAAPHDDAARAHQTRHPAATGDRPPRGIPPPDPDAHGPIRPPLRGRA